MIEGRYFEAGSSRSVPARLWGGPGTLRLMAEGDAQPRQPILTAVSDRLARVPRKFTFADGSVFEAPPEADVDGLMQSHGSFFTRLTHLEGNWKFVAFAAVATVVLLMGIYRYGVPLAASAAASATPPIVLTAMDRGIFETVDRVFFEESQLSDERRRSVQQIFDQLAGLAEIDRPELTLHFRDGGRLDANAFALPGGSIAITDQLIAKAENDDEIAGVLAHEIGHVAERHSLKQIYRAAGIAFMIGVIGGDSSQLVDDVVSQAAALQTLAYTREFEADADRYSVGLMLEAGRDPMAFVDLLDRVSKDRPGAKETGWMSTHPGTVDRRQEVNRLVEESRR